MKDVRAKLKPPSVTIQNFSGDQVNVIRSSLSLVTRSWFQFSSDIFHKIKALGFHALRYGVCFTSEPSIAIYRND